MADITAEVVADSISPFGKRITTLKLRYPRFIHSEFMTHRMFSRNASSSRAIPVRKEVDRVIDDPAIPIHIGKNQKGMQAYEELSKDDRDTVIQHLSRLGHYVAGEIEFLSESYGVHKQVLNRYLEPWQYIDVLVTSTEWGNFFYLRDNEAAQPEIRCLAQKMKLAMENSTPRDVLSGGYHMPFFTEDLLELELDSNILACVARCARVSYRNHSGETDAEKDIRLAKQLYVAGHLSPFEHVAKAADDKFYSNFRGWQSVRNIKEGSINSVKEEEEERQKV